MIRSAVTSLVQLLVTVVKFSVALFYTQWTHRYLLYLGAFMLFGVWTHVGLEIYGWATWRVTSINFRGNHVLQTMINFGLCFYLTDEWLARLTGRWGRFVNRTLGKQALIWGVSFVAAFYVQRTLVFEGIQYYALDIYFYYQQYPAMRPRPLDHFLFCLPFFICTIFLLWLVIFVRQRGIIKERASLGSNQQKLVTPKEKLHPKLLSGESGRESIPLCFESGGSQIILDQDSISHITVEDHYCRIYVLEEGAAKSYFIKSSLSGLLKQLPKSHFLQIHRSHVVNVRSIRQLEKRSRASRVHLKSNIVLPVSRYRLDGVFAQLKEALELSGDEQGKKSGNTI